jgi:P-type Cu+ transporter
LVTTVVFDKTGTLTVGKPSVVRVQIGSPNSEIAQSGPGEAAALQLAAGLARHSTHPVSQAIARLSTGGTEVSAWEEIHGAGVLGRAHTRPAREKGNPTADFRDPKPLRTDRNLAGDGSDDGEVARLGSLGWLAGAGVDLGPAEAFVKEWSAEGATVVGLAEGTRLLGLFAVKDTVKSGAAAVVRKLQRQGLKTCLVTGDNPLTAASIARQAGIPFKHVFAEVRPERKAEFVKKLQAQGERVAFVGDGINDAPALEQADLGIAVSRASDIAREAADIILLKSELEAVPESLGLARATLRTIKQNLFWAFFYNAVGIPLAALGFMSPILCAAAMGLSDLVVIGNALRLRRWREAG